MRGGWLWFSLVVGAAFVLAACGRAAEPPAQPEADVPALEVLPDPPEVEPAPAGEDAFETAMIARDEWGVPHIHAESEEAAAYALGYAMAEDRLEHLCQNILVATGRAASVFGIDHLETDIAMNIVKNDERCRTYFEEHDNAVTRLSAALMRGVRRYAEENPDALPEWAPELEDHHPMALGRTMILQWPLGTIMSDYGRRDEAPAFGSNGWAVMPERTEEGVAILSADPHITWETIQVFYEARFTGGGLVQNGFFLLGVPFLAIGHNEHVAWACTTGGPDTSDVYAMRINEEGQYEFEGEWHEPEREIIKIPVEGFGEIEFPLVTTRYGFMVPDPAGNNPDTENGVMYVGRSLYFEDMGLVEQMYRMVHAKNAEEFHEALGMNHFMEQNLIFADREGNIGYVRTGRVPIRPEGYDWRRPVPGNTAETDWLGIHPIEDLVQIMNPPQGYMQNNNISPANMMAGSPMTADKYPDYIFNVSWDENNPRGRRGLAVLDANDTMTVADAIALVVDVYDIGAKPWQAALGAAAESHGEQLLAENEGAAAGLAHMLEWDGHCVPEAVGPLWMMELRLASRGQLDTEAVATGEPLTDEDLVSLMAVLEETAETMHDKYGGYDAAWGDVHVVGREGQYFPSPGLDYGSRGDMTLTETLFNTQYTDLDDGSGRRVANNGSGCPMLMIMRPEGIESYSAVPWGQSGDPASPHFMDQGEKLYSQRQMKRNWHAVDDWRERLGAGTVLEVR